MIYNKYNPKDIFRPENLFLDNFEPNVNKPTLLFKNWNEICYIYNDYDLHNINFEIKAKGVPEDECLNLCSIGLSKNIKVENLSLEIDGKSEKVTIKNNNIIFEIDLENGQSNKVHLQYKEFPLISELSEGKIKARKFYREKYYGIIKIVANQKAIFTLINKSDFEIISFDNIFLLEAKENDYIWVGKVLLKV
jgi:hypothetical protein